MIENLVKLEQDARKRILGTKDQETLEKLRVELLGKKGAITEVLRSISGLPIEERKSVGENANRIKNEIQNLIESKINEIKKIIYLQKLYENRIDISLPPFPFPIGHIHPLRQTLQEISEIFQALGFDIALGPEIETEWYNFEALNIPADHPARDVQDTFYLKDGKRLLRTHTSPVQIHVMEKQKPPVKVIVPGKVYRNEATDATHSAMFHQIEGLSVDTNITFADLKGTLTLFVHRFFGSDVALRFRPSHFQFTEPSAEVDIRCTMCKGIGCRICKNSGWLEMIGCGMVHPNVFRAVKYDTEKFTGFAFGMGVDRLAMFKYGIDDMRLFFENNLQFLKQF